MQIKLLSIVLLILIMSIGCKSESKSVLTQGFRRENRLINSRVENFVPNSIIDQGYEFKDYAVVLTIPNCTGCKEMYSVIDTLREQGYLIYVFNISKPEFSTFAEKYHVNSFPTSILYKGGKEFDRIIGAISQSWFKFRIQTLKEQKIKLPFEYILF